MTAEHEKALDRQIQMFMDFDAKAKAEEQARRIQWYFMCYVEATFDHAIREIMGEMPSDEECIRRGMIVITHDKTKHLLWDHPPVKEGGKIDLGYSIASVAPLKFNTTD